MTGSAHLPCTSHFMEVEIVLSDFLSSETTDFRYIGRFHLSVVRAIFTAFQRKG